MPDHRTKSNWYDTGRAIIAIVLLGIGCWWAYDTGRFAIDWWHTRGWSEVPATVAAVEMVPFAVGGNTDYRVQAHYVYQVQGREYHGRRLSLTHGRLRSPEWHQRVYRRLKRAQSQETPITCFVNPANPADALLFRELHPRALLIRLVPTLIFTIAGTGMLVVLIVQFMVVRGASHLSADEAWPSPETPAQPAPRVVRPVGRRRRWVGAAWALAILWTGWVWVGLLYGIRTQAMTNENLERLVLLAILAVGIALLLFAGLMTRRYILWARCRLRVISVTSTDREGLDLAIQLPQRLSRASRFVVCYGMAREQEPERWCQPGVRAEDYAWQVCEQTDRPPARGLAGILRLTFPFQPPPKAGSTDHEPSSGAVSTPCVVRVFAVSADRRPLVCFQIDPDTVESHSSSPTSGWNAPAAPVARQVGEMPAGPTPQRPTPSRQILRSFDPQGNEWLRISCWPGLVVGGGLWSLAVLLPATVAWILLRMLVLTWLWAIPAGLLAVAALFVWIGCLSHLGGYEIGLMKRELTVARYLFFLSRQHVLPKAYIVEVTRRMTATTGRTHYYAIQLRLTDGHLVRVAQNVRGDLSARWIVHELTHHLSESSSGSTRHKSLRYNF